VLNVQVRFRGRLEIPLDEQGKREAWLAARNLAGANIAAVYTSPLWRAREVAQAIATVTSSDVIDHPGFLNLDYGQWEGLTKQECARRDPELWKLYRTAPEQAVCPGGEALADAADRLMDALRYIGDEHPGQAVAAVTHGVMVRFAILRVQPQPDWEVPLATGSSVVFEVKDGKVSLAPEVALPSQAERVAAAASRLSESPAFAS
jgi:broad specificity phosphatase PhoE